MVAVLSMMSTHASSSKYKIFFGGLTYLLLLSFVILLALAASFFSNPYFLPTSDWGAFISGGDIIRSGDGPHLYDLPTQLRYEQALTPDIPRKRPLPFRYPPFLALIYLPFTFLPFFLSYWVSIVCNLLLIGLFTRLIPGLYPNIKHYSLWFLLPFAFYPFIGVVLFGQMTVAFMVILLGVMLLIQKKQLWISGALFSLLWAKPHYILFLLPFLLILLKDRKKFLFGLICTSSVLLMLSIFLTGWQGLSQYPALIQATENSDYGSRITDMSNLYAFLIQVLLPKTALWVPQSIVFLAYLLVMYLFWSDRFFLQRQLIPSFSLVGTLVPLLFLHTLSHDLSLLVFPLFFLMNRWAHQPMKIMLFVDLILFYLFLAFLPLIPALWRPLFLILFAARLGSVLWHSFRSRLLA